MHSINYNNFTMRFFTGQVKDKSVPAGLERSMPFYLVHEPPSKPRKEGPPVIQLTEESRVTYLDRNAVPKHGGRTGVQLTPQPVCSQSH